MAAGYGWAGRSDAGVTPSACSVTNVENVRVPYHRFVRAAQTANGTKRFGFVPLPFICNYQQLRGGHVVIESILIRLTFAPPIVVPGRRLVRVTPRMFFHFKTAFFPNSTVCPTFYFKRPTLITIPV